MKIVIDIPEKYLNSSSGIIDVTLFTGENNVITDVNVEDDYAKFQVLPKGHGALMDADILLNKWDNLSVRGRTEFDQVIMCTPVVISADNGGKNENSN